MKHSKQGNRVRVQKESVTARRKAYNPFTNFQNKFSKKNKNRLDGTNDDENPLDKKTKRLLIAFIAISVITCMLSLCALGSPYWSFHGVSNDTYPFETSEGLLMACAYPYSSNITCGWIYFSNKPSWFLATTALWLTGVLGYFLCTMLSCFLCTSWGRNIKFPTILAIGSLVTTCLLLIAVIIWGVSSKGLLQTSEVHHYEWGFYIAVTATVLASITTILLFCIIWAVRNQLQKN